MTQEDAQELEALERSLLTGAVRKDPAAVRALLAEEFREFGASGRTYTREAIVAELWTEPPVDLAMVDFRAEPVSEEIVLVTYRSSRSEAGHAVRVALRSSLWVRREGRWQMVFHQGTVVPDAAGLSPDIQS